MLNKSRPSLLSQHGRNAPPASSWLPTQAPKRLEQRSALPYGYRPPGLLTGADEMLFLADPLHFVNDPRFMINPWYVGRSLALQSPPDRHTLGLEMFPERKSNE
jgi:hypothetical protein